MGKTSELRSRTMRAVKSRNTAPELTVRSLAHRMGYRFRLHRDNLAGKPDLVFPRLNKVIFVHGCFWHGHDCVRGARVPKDNREYWLGKISGNRARDQKNLKQLTKLGWKSLVIWECDLGDEQRTKAQLRRFLKSH
jgi:DNA mismatch endonuclease (patch repair protein)